MAQRCGTSLVGAAFLLLLPVAGIAGFMVNALNNPGHNAPPDATPTPAASTDATLTPTPAPSTAASLSGKDGSRLIAQATARSGGLTITVTRVALDPWGNTRIELMVQNETDTEMKLPLDIGNSTFRDDDGNWLPASHFTSTEWPGIIPAHQFRRGAILFERRFPARATKAALVLKFNGSPDGITVGDINLGPG